MDRRTFRLFVNFYQSVENRLIHITCLAKEGKLMIFLHVIMRDTIAREMWTSYEAELQRRGRK